MNRLETVSVADVLRGLARYRPFILLLAAVWLVVTVAPGEPAPPDAGDGGSAAVAVDTAGTDTPGDTASETPVAGAGDAAAGPSPDVAATDGSSTAGASGGRGTTSGRVGRTAAPVTGATAVANCDSATGRIKIPSKFAPMCVRAFSGDNGGATWQGVTKDKIKLVWYQAQDNPAAEAILAAAGADDSPQEIEQQVRDFVQFYEAHFNLWGRKTDLVFVQGSGAATDDAAGKADAIKVATEIKAFASLNAPNNTYVDELVARKVMCMCTVSLPIDFYTKRAPYVWSTLMASHQGYVHRAEYIGKRLAGKPAKWAGNPTFTTQPRKFGLLWYETKDGGYKSGIDFFVKELREKYGVTLASQASYNGYPDIAATQQQARPLIQKMVADGVNAVICACDPFAPIFFTQEATRQAYRPEWIVTGSALTDTSFFARTYDQEQWAHAFGLSFLTARVPEELGEAYRLHQWHFGRPPVADTYGVIRAPIEIFYQGVHHAGPRLTPTSFRDGLWGIPITGKGGVTTATVSWGPKGIWPWDDYLQLDDTTEIWWDRTAQGEDDIGNDGIGLYRYVDGGKRYLPGEHPRSDPKAFDPAGTVTIYDKQPPQDRYPEYPPPKR